MFLKLYRTMDLLSRGFDAIVSSHCVAEAIYLRCCAPSASVRVCHKPSERDRIETWNMCKSWRKNDLIFNVGGRISRIRINAKLRECKALHYTK